MVRLTYGVFATILKLCCKGYKGKRQNRVFPQKKLNGALLFSIDPIYNASSDDNLATTLFTCVKNVPPGLSSSASKINVEDVTTRFRTKVEPMINPLKMKGIEETLKHLIKNDETIRDDTIILKMGDFSERQAISFQSLDFSSFLSRVLIYCVSIAINEDGKETVALINKDFIEKFENAVAQDEADRKRDVLVGNNSVSGNETTEVFDQEAIHSIGMKAGSVTVDPSLPFPRNDDFTGRDDILKKLCDGFSGSHTATQSQTLYGMGGVGKTQIALEYAYRHYSSYRYVKWVSADSDVALLEGALGFIKVMGLHNESDGKDLTTAKFRGWFETNEDWLLIFDNVEDSRSISGYLPKVGKGDVLITTRLSRGHIGCPIDVEKFNGLEAVEFLQRRSGLDDRMGAELLANRLGYLPLALEQAAAYIAETPDTGYSMYLSMLAKHGVKLFTENDEIRNSGQSVLVTWKVSASKIRNKSAHQLLMICAYLSPDSIGFSDIPKGDIHFPKPLREDFFDDMMRRRIIRDLSRYSLVKCSNGALHIHRLLQEVLREEIGNDTKWIDICFDLFCPDIIGETWNGRPDNEYARTPMRNSYSSHHQIVGYHMIQLARAKKDTKGLLQSAWYYFCIGCKTVLNPPADYQNDDTAESLLGRGALRAFADYMECGGRFLPSFVSYAYWCYSDLLNEGVIGGEDKWWIPMAKSTEIIKRISNSCAEYLTEEGSIEKTSDLFARIDRLREAESERVRDPDVEPHSDSAVRPKVPSAPKELLYRAIGEVEGVLGYIPNHNPNHTPISQSTSPSTPRTG
jgi:hypothetical protein